MLITTSTLCSLCLLPAVARGITVYSQVPLGQSTPTSVDPSAPAVTTLAAYNETILIPPPLPSPLPNLNVTLKPAKAAGAQPGLSIPHNGVSFFGFSIEMSVINQILGRNSSHISVPFLNLIANLQERSGGVLIRLGGNTQERAALVPSLPNGTVISKEDVNSQQTTQTPAVVYTDDLFYLANNISSMVNVKWYLGLPFNDSMNWRLEIAERGQAILGDNLVGLQAGNEPDQYFRNGHRGPTYSPPDYINELTSLIAAINSNANIPVKNQLVAPSISTFWTLQQLFDAGLLNLTSQTSALTVERYPSNNCAAQFHTGDPIIDPQAIFEDYLNHGAVVGLVKDYLGGTAVAQQLGKDFIMFETNTASCGGFAGISKSYGASLWMLDYGLQMAYSNFTHALTHFGGQSVFYNAFTPPPTNQSIFNEWTVGSIYYSILILAEAFGKSNTSRTIDLTGDNNFTPAYAIYQQDILSSFALINYMDDPTGGNTVTFSLSADSPMPSSVKVKYLTSDSVSTHNISWAGQDFGGQFQVDGRLKGTLNVTSITCDTTANTCAVPVPAPGFALVFLGDSDEVGVGQSPVTFSTSAFTKTVNTLTVDPSLLATSNGHSEKDRVGFAGTSPGSNGAVGGVVGTARFVGWVCVGLSVLMVL